LEPVSTAVALALLSVVPVAWSLLLKPPVPLDNEGYVTPPVDWRPMGLMPALVLALVTVVLAALVSGALGGWLVRRHRATGLFVTLALAWLTAVAVLPVAATLLGIHLRTAIACVFACESNVRSGEPLSGLWAALVVLVSVFQLYVALIVPAVVLIVGQNRRSLALLVFGVVLAHAILYALALFAFGAHIPYVTLVVGFAAWAYVVRDHFAPWPPPLPEPPTGPPAWNPPNVQPAKATERPP
jgi:hypothetical protein